jgi:branched-chain amino acid transport system permease protein
VLVAVDWGFIVERFFSDAFSAEAAAFAVAAIGLNVHFGYTGLLNFGQAGFMLIAGYGLGMTVTEDVLGGSFWLGLVTGVLFSIGLALLLGIPTLRLRADYLAIVTIAAAEILRLLGRSTALRELTGGAEGLSGWTSSFYDLNPFSPDGRYELGPFNFQGRQLYVALVGWIVAVVLAFLVGLLMRSPWGRVVKGIREDEDAVRSLGKNAYWYKMQALMLGGAIGGIGGMIRVTAASSVQPDNFVPPITFFVWTILIIGGAARVWSPLVGAIVFWGLLSASENLLRELVEDDKVPDWLLTLPQVFQIRFMIVGLVLMLLMVFRPQGIFGDRREMALDDR